MGVSWKKIFSLRPSFWTLLSGCLLSIAINMLTNLFFVQEESFDLKFLQFVFSIIASLLISSGSFIGLSLVLEEYREEYILADFLDKITKDEHLRVKLWVLFLIGLISLISALLAIFYWLYLYFIS